MERNEQLLETVRKLADNWKRLRYAVMNDNELDYAVFKKTFSETYHLLKSCAGDTAVDKAYMELIVDAYGFVNISGLSTINNAFAALVLTERMLQCCVFAGEGEDAVRGGATLYLLEEREALHVDFEKVEESIHRITEALQKSYWKNI